MVSPVVIALAHLFGQKETILRLTLLMLPRSKAPDQQSSRAPTSPEGAVCLVASPGLLGTCRSPHRQRSNGQTDLLVRQLTDSSSVILTVVPTQQGSVTGGHTRSTVQELPVVLVPRGKCAAPSALASETTYSMTPGMVVVTRLDSLTYKTASRGGMVTVLAGFRCKHTWISSLPAPGEYPMVIR
jgi:hypothetical protein